MSVQPKLYSHFTYQNGVSIVSLFISTGRLAMPDFEGWSQQVLTLFLCYLIMLSLNRVLEWKKDIEISKEVLFKLGFETNDENI